MTDNAHVRRLMGGRPQTPRSSAEGSASSRAELSAAMAAAEAGRALSAEARDEVRWCAAMALLAAAGDPATAARLERNDLYRAERALEVVRATGRPMADFKPGAHAADASPYDFRCAFFSLHFIGSCCCAF